jgi:hypothetical protein
VVVGDLALAIVEDVAPIPARTLRPLELLVDPDVLADDPLE